MRKLTALLVLVLAVGCKEQPPARSYGRYQIVKDVIEQRNSPNGEKTFALIDTDLGQVWILADEAGMSPALVPIPLLDEAALFRATGRTMDDVKQKIFEEWQEQRQKEEQLAEEKKKEEEKGTHE
jgi:hypothetical protein